MEALQPADISVVSNQRQRDIAGRMASSHIESYGKTTENPLSQRPAGGADLGRKPWRPVDMAVNAAGSLIAMSDSTLRSLRQLLRQTPVAHTVDGQTALACG